MTFMKTAFIHIRSPGAAFIRLHFINGWPHFEYPERKQTFQFAVWDSHKRKNCGFNPTKRNLQWAVTIIYGYLRWSKLLNFSQNFQNLSLSSFQDIRHLQFNRVGRNFEFALHPQHETSFDSRTQLSKDFNYFKSKSRKQKFVDGLIA